MTDINTIASPTGSKHILFFLAYVDMKKQLVMKNNVF
ncbi:hypothetical protein NC652_019953 [Populus alba x Populus x berolinensis]|nr:hypothetical protein NC652_019953 [Populus alba x Populus x berolinensis]